MNWSVRCLVAFWDTRGHALDRDLRFFYSSLGDWGDDRRPTFR